MLLLVLVPERSTARKSIPASPPGFIVPEKLKLPPMLAAVLWSKLGVTAPFFALVERMHQTWSVFTFTPPIKRLPVESTSGVPHWGELGMKIGSSQLTPPSMERLNCLPP